MMSLRIISCLCLFYFLVLIVIRGGAGFQYLWLAVGILSGILSIKPVGNWFFSSPWINVFMIFCVGFFIVVEIIIFINGFDTKAKQEVDYLIVLGAGVRGTKPSLILRHRLDRAYAYLSENERTLVIVSGGQGRGEDITEALAMKNYLLAKGLHQSRIIMEEWATDTSENMKYSFNIIDRTNPDARVGIVTTRFHLFRSKMIAKHYGRTVEGYGAKNYWPATPHYYVREFFGVMKELVFKMS